MNEPESLRAIVEAAASSPKVAAAVSAGAISMGTAAKLELIQSTLGLASMAVGLLTALVVLCIQSIKLIRVWRGKADQ